MRRNTCLTDGFRDDAVPGQPALRMFFELSTAHLTMATRALLDDMCREIDLDRGKVSNNPLCVAATDHGWWVLTPESSKGLPADLLAVVVLARSLGADAIRFDADGELIDSLPVYEDPSS